MAKKGKSFRLSDEQIARLRWYAEGCKTSETKIIEAMIDFVTEIEGGTSFWGYLHLRLAKE